MFKKKKNLFFFLSFFLSVCLFLIAQHNCHGIFRVSSYDKIQFLFKKIS